MQWGYSAERCGSTPDTEVACGARLASQEGCFLEIGRAVGVVAERACLLARVTMLIIGDVPTCISACCAARAAPQRDAPAAADR